MELAVYTYELVQGAVIISDLRVDVVVYYWIMCELMCTHIIPSSPDVQDLCTCPHTGHIRILPEVGKSVTW